MNTSNMTMQNEGTGYSSRPAAYFEAQLAAARQLLQTWKHRARSRRALAGLSPRLLEDAGIDTRQARQEAARPFWRA